MPTVVIAALAALLVVLAIVQLRHANNVSLPETKLPQDTPITVSTLPPGVSNDASGNNKASTETTSRPLDSEQIQNELARLQIAQTGSSTGYSRAMFPTWLDLDGNGCSAREDVLIAASQVPVQPGAKCAVTVGKWYSSFDDATFTDARKVDIDHVVPLANAWRSGAANWETNRRVAFANDTSRGGELQVQSQVSNRAKGDSSPDAWRPSNKASWCGYAKAWVAVKVKWQLTATTSERDALGKMLETCGK